VFTKESKSGVSLDLLLILAVAGGAFAQEVTWSGEVATGALIQLGDSYDDPVIKADDDDDDRAIRARLNAEVDGGNWGLQLGIGADWKSPSFDQDAFDVVFAAATAAGSTDTLDEFMEKYGKEFTDIDDVSVGGNLSLYNAHGWGTIADMATVRAGLIDPGVWTVGGWVDENISSGLGIRVEIHPMEGLSLGAFIPTPYGGNVLEDSFKDGFGMGFSYAQEDLFEFSAGFGLYISDPVFGFVGDDITNLTQLADFDNWYTPGEEEMKVIVGFGFYGVENLSVYVGLAALDLLEADDPTIKIGLNADYVVTDQLGVALEAGFTLCDGIQEIEFTPSVTFLATEDISLGAGVTGVLKNDDSDDLGLSNFKADLWVQYDIGNSFIKAGYGFDVGTKDFADATDHYIRLLFGYAF